MHFRDTLRNKKRAIYSILKAMPTEILTVLVSALCEFLRLDPSVLWAWSVAQSHRAHSSFWNAGMGRVPSCAGSLLELAFMHVAGYLQYSSQAQGQGLAEVNAPWTSGVSQADWSLTHSLPLTGGMRHPGQPSVENRSIPGINQSYIKDGVSLERRILCGSLEAFIYTCCANNKSLPIS